MMSNPTTNTTIPVLTVERISDIDDHYQSIIYSHKYLCIYNSVMPVLHTTLHMNTIPACLTVLMKTLAKKARGTILQL